MNKGWLEKTMAFTSDIYEKTMAFTSDIKNTYKLSCEKKIIFHVKPKKICKTLEKIS
jgi:hypothetical protein